VKRVVVVDDDFMVARVNSGYVDRIEGFTVVGVAHTAAEALEAVRSLQPDLVLLDVHLPDRSGLEVLQELRGEGSDVEVLMVSAARDVETVQRARRAGAVHYIVKPFEQATLQARLEEFAGRRVPTEVAAQHDVDTLFARGDVSTAAPMPKGLASETTALVIRTLQSADELSAGECGQSAGLSRVSARRYLEYLVATGRATVRLQYGAAGRPERRYRWSGGTAP
jgi:response regulator of citrate/malate metabolism